MAARRKTPHVEVLMLTGPDADNLRDLSRQVELPGLVVVRIGLSILRFLSRLESHGWHVAIRTHDGDVIRTYELKDILPPDHMPKKNPPPPDGGSSLK
jgi:hypothetical protein